MKKYQIAIVGGGIIGSEIARYLTAKSLTCVLIEKEADVAEGGATKANSGIIHAGFDCEVGSMKAKMNIRGSELYPELAKRLGITLVNTGALVVGREEDLPKIQKLYEQGKASGVKELEIVGREVILDKAPTAHPSIVHALWAGTSSIISPYMAAIAMAEEAKLNGCDFYFDSRLEDVKKVEGGYILKAEGAEIFAECVINAAGAGSKKVNELFGAEDFPLRFARGEYLLLDLSERGFVYCTIFPIPTELGKGVLCSPTVHGNIIVGPTAIDAEADENVISYEGLDYIKSSMGRMLEKLNTRKNIRVFSGNRVISGEDFVIKKSEIAKGLIYLGGICSPGLSSAPAISEYVASLVETLGFELKDKEDIILRKPYTETLHMSDSELNALIAKDSRYGKIVCRCEKVTEGEIVEVINSPLAPSTIDGVKRRVRAGMGRCQGGFCMPRVMELIAKERGISVEDVTKFGSGSEILVKVEEEV